MLQGSQSTRNDHQRLVTLSHQARNGRSDLGSTLDQQRLMLNQNSSLDIPLQSLNKKRSSPSSKRSKGFTSRVKASELKNYSNYASGLPDLFLNERKWKEDFVWFKKDRKQHRDQDLVKLQP